MIPRQSEQKEAAFGYVGGFLNACYLAGFARRLKLDHVENMVDQINTMQEGDEMFEGDTRLQSEEPTAEGKEPSKKAGSGSRPYFYIQQTNNVNVAIPITASKGNINMPGDTEETKVIGRLVGKTLPDGTRTMAVRALQITKPSIRDMPNYAAWNKPDVKNGGGVKDTFKPFFDKADTEDLKMSPFAKADGKGRQCLNVAHIAGFVQAFTWPRDKDNNIRKNCILLLVRQGANPDESIPVRVYGQQVEPIYRALSIGMPVLIEGVVRQRVQPTGMKREDGVEIVRSQTYIHTSDVKQASRKTIQVTPQWYIELRERNIADRKRRAMEAARHIQSIAEASKKSDDSSDDDLDFS